MSTFDCGKIEKHSACCVENVPLKKLNRSYFGNLPHFLHFPYSPPFLMLCVSILLVVLNNFFHFVFPAQPQQQRSDHFRFLGTCPPTPPLSQHQDLILAQGKIFAQGRGGWAVFPETLIVECQYCQPRKKVYLVCTRRMHCLNNNKIIFVSCRLLNTFERQLSYSNSMVPSTLKTEGQCYSRKKMSALVQTCGNLS